MPKQREIWVDNVKVIACILVLLGHFFQSMTKSNVLPANDLYQWFNQTIYMFHVPLFFICSGYLYQKYSRVDDIRSWIKNVLKKALNLGIPYFTFSFATWLLKTVFSGSTNDEIGGVFDTLFLHPTSPYWYLYALFFIFLITPTFRSRRMAISGLAIAFILKTLGIIWGGGQDIQAIQYILDREIWFVIGMCLSVFEFKAFTKITTSVVAGLTLIALSVAAHLAGIENGFIGFGLGVLACFSVIGIVMSGSKQSWWLSQYTMPIFLMHTLFAAPLRTVLFKLGIQNAIIHVVLGIGISIVGPTVAGMVMKKMKWPEFFLYSGKFIKVK
mgnify:CR=1 FL=1